MARRLISNDQVLADMLADRRSRRSGSVPRWPGRWPRR